MMMKTYVRINHLETKLNCSLEIVGISLFNIYAVAKHSRATMQQLNRENV